MGEPEQPESNGQVVLDAEGRPADQASADTTEDVLAEQRSDTAPDEEPAEEPDDGPVGPVRTWRTRGDYVALALLLVAVLVGGLLVWAFSDVRNTDSRTGPSEVALLPPVTVLPPSLGEVWRAPSAATPVPVSVDSVVVTGDGGEVVGRDPLTGDVRWSYRRNWPLCTVSTAWGRAFALYRKDTNCSELTTLDLASGKRGPQRNGDAANDTRLLNEGSHVLATGNTYFEVYRRDDLVRSLEYGNLRAIVNAGKQPRPGCEYGSFAVTSGKVAVVERCYALDPSDRLTILKPNPEKFDEPQVMSSVVVGEKGARVVALTNNRVAVAVPGKLQVFDADTGGLIRDYPVEVTAEELAGDPPGRVVASTTSTANVYWFTGSRTIALSLVDLNPVWSLPAQGPATTLAGRALVPVRDGLAVVDQVTGQVAARIPVNRDGYTGPVLPATEGPIVFEQRGGTLVALR
ncbi:Rv3212 family protein [Saccharothrix obliqua]|uniref:Rv3212 family protein n=1 Tax=Saccharothrix obliqua TaxID=2861747 RepID=UPI001C607D30|nr:PQQ-binding-like beta-propeller repeat protein [Saccharothrix obliqua]MBW4719315.1 PQQ-binding-like beta-propeller repeat protein [Saccharothrix obliqua]